MPTRKRARQEVVGAIPFPSPLQIARAPRAKLDFITLTQPLGDAHPPALFDVLARALEAGRLQLPDRGWHTWMTIHDPDPIDLQGLVDYYPQGEIISLEVAMDYRPKRPSRAALESIYSYLYLGKL